MNTREQIMKRVFDLIIAVPTIIIFSPAILLLAILARRSTGNSGLFRQTRIGRFGNAFTIVKLRTMRADEKLVTTVTVDKDPRITPFGAFLRKTKLDELPQLWNIVVGDMSLVGPRPDVPGFADQLEDGAERVLELRPGITGPATVKYRDEEEILAAKDDPEKYNADVIYPDKIKLNTEYFDNWSLLGDVRILLVTIGLLRPR